MQSCKHYFEEQLFLEWVVKVPSKRGFAIGTKFSSPYSDLFMTGSKGEFFKTASLNLSFGYDTLMRFLIYGPKVPKN